MSKETNSPTEDIPDAEKIGRSSNSWTPEPTDGYSIWIENGVWFSAPTVDPAKFGCHAYDDGGYEQGIRDCPCGAWMLSSSSGGKVDPFGACPLNPKPSVEKETAVTTRNGVVVRAGLQVRVLSALADSTIADPAIAENGQVRVRNWGIRGGIVPVDAADLLAFLPPSTPVAVEPESVAPCRNCGHAVVHNRPAGTVDDACPADRCTCGYYEPVEPERGVVEKIRSAAVRKAGVVYPCFAHTYLEITRLNLDAPEDVLRGENSEQGFITTRGQFVDRFEAMLIADRTGQLVHAHALVHGLFSEDLRAQPTPTAVEDVREAAGKLVAPFTSIQEGTWGASLVNDIAALIIEERERHEGEK